MDTKFVPSSQSLVIAYSNQFEDIESTFCFNQEAIEYQQINKTNPEASNKFTFDISVLIDLDPQLATQLLAVIRANIITLARDAINYEFDSARFHNEVMNLVQQSLWYEVDDFQNYFKQLVKSYSAMLELLMINLQAPFKTLHHTAPILVNNTLH